MKNSSISRCEKIAPKIYRIILPLPGKKPGPVNAYLFLGKKVTLLDTGTLRTIGTLRDALSEIDVGFSNIRQIVLTHGHFDHYGAARRIAKKAGEAGGGIVIAGHEEDKKLVEYGMEVPLKQFAGYFRLMGIPILHRMLIGIMQNIFSAYQYF